jgi:hypothetical protein
VIGASYQRVSWPITACLAQSKRRSGVSGITGRQSSLRIDQEVPTWYEWLPPVRVDVYLWAFFRVNLFDWRPAEHGGPLDESSVTTLLDVAAGM